MLLLCWLALLLIRIIENTTGATWNRLAAELGRLHAITYTGPATVIDPSGAEHEVWAHLTSTKLGEITFWLGTLRGSAPWFAMMGATCVVRVGTREAPFAVHDFDGDGGPASIEGSGRPPFGD